MMKQEFEQFAGYEVSAEDYYNIIEPMYMATNLSKQDFVKCIDKKRFALKTRTQLINEAKKIAKEYPDMFSSLEQVKAENRLADIMDEIQNRFYGGCTVACNWETRIESWSGQVPTEIEVWSRTTYNTLATFKLA